MHRWNAFAAAALLAVAALHLTSVPLTLWEYDENLYAQGVEHFQPLLHHPPPPGAPVYIGFAKVVNVFTGDAFAALRATSVIALLAGMAAWVLGFRSLTDFRTAVIATVLLYGCPAVLISGTLPQADVGALALFGFAVWAGGEGRRAQGAGRRNAVGREPQGGEPTGRDLAGGQASSALCALRSALWPIACAAVAGWRPQFSIAIVPMFLASLFFRKTWRERIVAVVAFGLACLAWFIPLVMAAGGPLSYWKWLSGQAAYYAAHDADLSRSGMSPLLIAVRFLAHPWGPKWLSLPLLALAALGLVRFRRPLLPLACGSLVYLGFAIATMDPNDAVRYVIPSLPFLALLAALALARLPALAPLALLYALGSWWYAAPVLRTRATVPSPPFAAARWIEANVPRGAVVLYDLPLGPHASYLLRGWTTMRIDAGLARYGADTRVPIVLFTDGERSGNAGVTFRWPDTDAYRKLTRQHYGAVSVVPLPPSQRFRALAGVYAPERRRDGASWRWLGRRAVLELPDLGATRVKLTFRIPPDYPLAGNRVIVGRQSIALQRDGSADVIVPYARRIEIVAAQAFVPAQIRGANNRDARTLSVMLTSVEQLDPRTRGAADR